MKTFFDRDLLIGVVLGIVTGLIGFVIFAPYLMMVFIQWLAG